MSLSQSPSIALQSLCVSMKTEIQGKSIDNQTIVASARPTSIMTTLTATGARKPPVRKAASKTASFKIYKDHSGHRRNLRTAPASISHPREDKSMASMNSQDQHHKPTASLSKLRRPAQRLNQNSSEKGLGSRIEKRLTGSRNYLGLNVRQNDGSEKENETIETKLCKTSIAQPRNSSESSRVHESKVTSRREQQQPQSGLYEPVASHVLGLGSDASENQQVCKEIILPALVNQIFDASTSYGNGRRETTYVEIYYSMKSVYDSGWCRLLSERLHDSLLQSDTDALFSMPKYERQTIIQKLTSKTRHRRKFLKFWSETYEKTYLRAALDVVTHRPMVLEEDEGDLEAYMGEYLIDNEDIEREPELGEENDDGDIMKRKKKIKETGHDTFLQLYCQVAVRSILMIIILDRVAAPWSLSTDTANGLRERARSAAQINAERTVFLAQSNHKSTAAALGELENLLFSPSTQDLSKLESESSHRNHNLVRVLHRLNCEVSYAQHPLAGFDYHVVNLAVDFRDGVRFAHLVEILFGFCSISGDGEGKGDKSMVGRMEKIRFPCLSRSDKLHNVQRALDLLQRHTAYDVHSKSLATITNGFKPEYIVDGYRERSITILWTIVDEIARRGNGAFLNIVGLRREVRRLQRVVGFPLGQAHAGLTTNSHEPETSLTEWISCLSRLRSSSQSYEGRGDQERSSRENDCAKLTEMALEEYQTLMEVDQNLKDEHLVIRLQRLGFDLRICKLSSSLFLWSCYPLPLILLFLIRTSTHFLHSVTTCI